MKILAVETSSKRLEIAIADENAVLAEYSSDALLKHSQNLCPAIRSLLQRIGAPLAALDAFCISIGPGSFTGLRVGVAFLKALNLVTRAPIITVPTLDIIAHNAARLGGHICVILDAKKKNIYTALYKVQDGGIIKVWGDRLERADGVIGKLEKVEGAISLLGDGIALYGDRIARQIRGVRLVRKRYWSADVRALVSLGREKFKQREFADPDSLVPMYIYSRECNVRGVER